MRAFAFFGGVSATVVPDNLKSAVLRAHRYDPDLNPAYQDLAAHYGMVVLPARVRRPRDKAMVESAVQVAERGILAPLREVTFFSLDLARRRRSRCGQFFERRALIWRQHQRRTIGFPRHERLHQELPMNRRHYRSFRNFIDGTNY